MKKWNNFALTLCVALLAVCVVSVYVPMGGKTSGDEQQTTTQNDSTDYDTASRYKNQ
mgnify:FL=1